MKTTVITSAALAILFFSVGFTFFRYEKEEFQVVVKPVSSFVMKGDKYFAELYLSKKIPTSCDLKVKGKVGTDDKIEQLADKIIFSSTVSNEGMQKFQGKVLIKNADGSIQSLPFESNFIVAKPIAAVVTKYLIKGIANPVNISVHGIPPFDLKAESSNGKLVGTNGTYTLTPLAKGDCKITVSAQINSKSQVVSVHNFIVVETK